MALLSWEPGVPVEASVAPAESAAAEPEVEPAAAEPDWSAPAEPAWGEPETASPTIDPIESPLSAGWAAAPGSPPAHVPPPAAASTPKPEPIRAAGLAVAANPVADDAPRVIVPIESLAPTVVDIRSLAPDAVDIATLAPDVAGAPTKPARDDFAQWLNRLQ
jgi:hypothetical protein